MGLFGGISNLLGTTNDFRARAPIIDFTATPAELQQQNYLQAIQQAMGNALSGGAQLAPVQGNQAQLIQALQNQLAGNGPSVAQNQLRQTLDQNQQQIAGAIASQRSLNPALGARLALQQQANMQQQAAGQGALLRAQEQQSAQGQLGNVLAQQGALALGQQNANTALAGTLGGLQGQNNQQQLQNWQTTQGLNQNTAAQNAANDLAAQNINAGVAAQNAQTNSNLAGGILQGAGSVLSGLGIGFAKGGEVPSEEEIRKEISKDKWKKFLEHLLLAGIGGGAGFAGGRWAAKKLFPTVGKAPLVGSIIGAGAGLKLAQGPNIDARYPAYLALHGAGGYGLGRYAGKSLFPGNGNAGRVGGIFGALSGASMGAGTLPYMYRGGEVPPNRKKAPSALEKKAFLAGLFAAGIAQDVLTSPKAGITGALLGAGAGALAAEPGERLRGAGFGGAAGLGIGALGAIAGPKYLPKYFSNKKAAAAATSLAALAGGYETGRVTSRRTPFEERMGQHPTLAFAKGGIVGLFEKAFVKTKTGNKKLLELLAKHPNYAGLALGAGAGALTAGEEHRLKGALKGGGLGVLGAKAARVLPEFPFPIPKALDSELLRKSWTHMSPYMPAATGLGAGLLGNVDTGPLVKRVEERIGFAKGGRAKKTAVGAGIGGAAGAALGYEAAVNNHLEDSIGILAKRGLFSPEEMAEEGLRSAGYARRHPFKSGMFGKYSPKANKKLLLLSLLGAGAGAAAGSQFELGGRVPGKAKVRGDSVKNDTVPALLSPGEIIVPRSKTDNAKEAAEFVARVLREKQTGMRHYAEGGDVAPSLTGNAALDELLASAPMPKPPMPQLPGPVPSLTGDPTVDAQIAGADIGPMTPPPAADYQSLLGPEWARQYEKKTSKPASSMGQNAPAFVVSPNLDRSTGKAQMQPSHAPRKVDFSGLAPVPVSYQGSAVPQMGAGLGAGFSQQKRGLQAEAEVQGQLGTQQAQILDQANTEQADLLAKHEKARAAFAQKRQELTSFFDNEANFKLDPNKFWASKSTGQKVAASIGLILGGAGSGLTGQPNAALQIIENAVNRDLEAQKVALTFKVHGKETLLANAWQELGDMDAAYLRAKDASLEIVERQLAKAAASAQGPLAKARAEQMAGQLEVQRQQLQMSFANLMVGRTIQYEGLTKGISPAKLSLIDPQQRQQYVPLPGMEGKLYAEASSPEGAQEIRTINQTLPGVMDKLARLEALNIYKNPSLILQNMFGRVDERVSALSNSIFLDLKTLTEAGRISSVTLDVFATQLSDPTALTSLLFREDATSELKRTLAQLPERAYMTHVPAYANKSPSAFGFVPAQ